MNDIYTKYQYSRHRPADRKKRRDYNKESGGILETVIRQSILAVLILGLIGIIKNVNTRPTNYLSDKIRQNLEYNINPRNLYSGVENFLSKLGNKNNDPFSEDAEAAGSGFNWLDNLRKGVNSKSLDDSPSNKINMIVPANGYVAGKFGYITSPVTGNEGFHSGIDIAVTGDGNVQAAHEGDVLETGSKREYGNYIKIKNGNITTVYANCSTISVKPGQKVKQGEVIARVSSVFGLPGTYLHFEVWENGTVRNPLDYVGIEVR